MIENRVEAQPVDVLKFPPEAPPSFELGLMLKEFVTINGDPVIPEQQIDNTCVDSLERVEVLEKYAAAASFIRQWYMRPALNPTERALAPLTQPMHSVDHIGNQFSTKIVPVFLYPEPAEALEMFRSISPQTTQQEMVLLINDTQFEDLHSGLQKHLEETESDRKRDVAHRFIDDPEIPGTFARADRNQFSGNETPRSLENILTNGITLSVDPEQIDSLRAAYLHAGEGIIPITEIVKNDKMLNIIGFQGSKISLAVHDVIDHTWMYALLRDRGYLDDYKQMLYSIGNPHHTDMFSREGETLASIAYGVRYFGMVENGFQPIFPTSKILEVADNLFQAGQLTEHRHIRAYRTLRAIPANSREWQSLGFAFSNYIVELDEQRRKHGAIKQRDESNKIIGELDPFSPDFLSIFIEAHHELHDSKNKHRDTLFRFHIILEQYLLGVASGAYSADQNLKLQVQNLKDIDLSTTVLPPGRLHWMFRNYGYTSVKDCIY